MYQYKMYTNPLSILPVGTQLKGGYGDVRPRYGVFSASQVYQWPLFYLKIGLDIGHVFANA